MIGALSTFSRNRSRRNSSPVGLLPLAWIVDFNWYWSCAWGRPNCRAIRELFKHFNPGKIMDTASPGWDGRTVFFLIQCTVVFRSKSHESRMRNRFRLTSVFFQVLSILGLVQLRLLVDKNCKLPVTATGQVRVYLLHTDSTLPLQYDSER